MYTGFTTKYPVNRPLDPLEREESLPHNARGEADEHASLVSYNSTYIEMVDRAFKRIQRTIDGIFGCEAGIHVNSTV